ncbi:MAG: hypothetical protein HXY22_07265 [Alphaproteobacteria bacterium]|nr:hypothetical protein [Alphaproteobacteria bacterium]
MIRVLNFLMLSLTIAICFGLYKITNETRDLQAQLRHTASEIAAEQETIEVLNAEWTLLVRPARLQELNERHLGLQTVSATQMLSIEDIPFRDEVSPTSSSSSSPLVQAPEAAGGRLLTVSARQTP